MSRPRKIDHNKVLSVFSETKNIAKTAEKLNISYSSARNILHQHNASITRGRPKGSLESGPRKNSKTAHVVAAVMRGKLNTKQICARYGVTRELVSVAKRRWVAK